MEVEVFVDDDAPPQPESAVTAESDAISTIPITIQRLRRLPRSPMRTRLRTGAANGQLEFEFAVVEAAV